MQKYPKCAIMTDFSERFASILQLTDAISEGVFDVEIKVGRIVTDLEGECLQNFLFTNYSQF